MSILTMTPGPEWYEPADIFDFDQDDAVCPPELLTAGWWSASADLEDLD